MTFCEVAIVGSAQETLTYHALHSVRIGEYVDAPLQKRWVKGVITAIVESPLFETRELRAWETPLFLTSSQLELARFIASYYICSLGEAISIFHPFSPLSCQDVSSYDQPPLVLSQTQEKALQTLRQHPVSLLFGVTGSGKTEVYIRLIQEGLIRHERTILLMPEIGLTPQMEKRLKHYFGNRVAIWHSKQTKKTKEKILDQIHQGQIDIVAGARSALFLPLNHVGLIIVDEEHDDSYKSTSKPRLHARDCAIVWGKMINAKVVLGSATPSLTTWQKFPHASMSQTFYPSTKKVMFVRGDDGIAESIFQMIDQALHDKKQVLVFAPTRGNFKILRCGVCGTTVQCPYCSVSMSLHKKIHALECHYCHYRSHIPTVCPSCELSHLDQFRIGTQEIVQKLEERFPRAIIAKFDRDEITTEQKLRSLLHDFNSHKIDILVGTQMLSKGHDYHNIGLAVVLGIDYILQIPDYRSREKAMQLLIQIGGRTGRKGEGTVVVQTHHEAFFAPYFEHYTQFLEDEMKMREDLYPPYVRMATILISHPLASEGEKLMKTVATHMATYKEVEVVGYAPAAIEKVSNLYRFMILLRSKSAQSLLHALHSLAPSRYLSLDIDPINSL